MFTERSSSLTGAALVLLATLGCLLAAPSPVGAQVPACGSVTDTLPRVLPTLPILPGIGQSYIDPVFGCTITRLSDAAAEGVVSVHHFYSSVNPFNADSSLVLLEKAPGGIMHIRDLSGKIIQDNLNRHGIQPHGEGVWSRTDPNVLYFHPLGGNTLRRYDVATDTVTTLHTFTGYTKIEFGHWEADISGDGDHLPILADSRYAFIYTISTGAVTPAQDLLAITGGVEVNVFDLTPSNRAMLNWGASNGGVAYFDQSMNFLGQVIPYAGHSDRARDADGADLEVAANAADSTPLPGCTNGIVKIRLADGTETCLLGMTWSSGAQHVSCNNAGQDWCLVSTYNGTPGTVAYTNELFQLKLDGSQTIRLAHSRTTNSGYFYTPRAAVSHDGKYVLFDSSMEGTVVDVYLLHVPDTTPPTVTVTAPPASSTVAGTVTVAATASDNVGVVGVQFKLNGTNLGAEVTVAPYTIAWNTTTAANGAHTLTAMARDAAGNQATSASVVVIVNNADITPPTVAVTSPLGGATVAGTITVAATAADDVGVAGVQFKLDGVNLGAEQTASPYVISWNTTTVANGVHTLAAVARDTSGNTTTSAPVTVTVSNDTVPPVISGIAASNISASAATITWTTDEASDSQVEYGTTTAYGSLTPLDTTLVTSHSQALSGLAASTLYHYRVKSKDAAGNLTASADFMFTTPDTTPPVLSAVKASAITSAGATIAWTTDEASDSQVEYGTTTAYGSLTPLNTALVTSHSQALSELAASTLYHYRVKSKDAAGNIAASSDQTFRTFAAPSTQSPFKGAPFPVPGLIEAEDFDLGGQGVAYHDAVAGNAGGLYRPSEDVDITSPGGVGYAVNNFQTGEWLEYTISVSTSGSYRLEANVSSQFTTSRFHIEIDGLDQTGSILVPNTGNWNTFQFVGKSGVNLTAGQHILKIYADQEYFNLDAIRISDVTPPTISAVTASSTTAVAATITWTTNEPADSQVEYGTTTTYGQATPVDASLVSSHRVALSGLAASTLYHYRVKAKDAAGNIAASSDQTFRTFAAPSTQSPFKGAPFAVPGLIEAEDFDLGGEGVAYHDAVAGNAGGLYRTSEDVDITSPGGVGYAVNNFQTGEWLEYTISVSTSGSYRLEANVSSQFTTSRFHIEIDGLDQTGSILVPNTGNWNTFQFVGKSGVNLTAGQHILKIYAEQEYFNLDAIRISDVTPPSVAITSPSEAATLSGTFTVSGTAADDGGLQRVEVLVQSDGSAPQTASGTTAWTLALDTRTLANGPHTIVARAVDAAGNAGSASVSVTVSNDVTSPTVAITSPLSGTTVSGTVTMTANAADAVGVVGVQFQVDGSNLGAEVTAPPYAVAWDTTTVPTGAHTLTARARDTAGNVGTSAAVSVTVVDATAPAVSMTAPPAGSILAGTVTVSAAATDNVGVAGVRFQLDGVGLGAEDTIPPYAVAWDTTTVPNGAHTLIAIARDAAGNVTASAGAAVTVDNPDLTAPTVSVTAPLNGATVSQTVTVSAMAADNIALAGVQFKLDGVNLGAEQTTAPYSLAWNTAPATNGVHTLAAVARDTSGNTTTSAAVTVTVSNDTVPPAISGVSASNISASSATITWTTDEPGDTQVEYGPTTAYGSLTPLNTVLVTAHSQTLSGLAGGSVYHYRVKSKDAAWNLAVSADFTFTTSVPPDNTPPTISAVSASGITSSAATITWTTNEAADSQVEYGTTTAYGSATTLDPLRVTVHSQALSGLTANTLYHYRVKSKDAAGNLAVSPDQTLSTLGVQSPFKGTPFAVPGLIEAEDFDLGGEGVAYHDAVAGNAGGLYRTSEDVDIIAATGNATGYVVNNIQTGEWLEYTISVSTSGSYHLEANVSSQFTTSRFHIEIDGLDHTGSILVPNTGNWNTFQFVGKSGVNLTAGQHILRVYAEQEYFNLDSIRILAADVTPPTISAVTASSITASGATITWTTDEASDSQVEYGLTTVYGQATLVDTPSVSSHSVALSGLTASTLYHYRVKSKDPAGNPATSADFTFTTPASPPASAGAPELPRAYIDTTYAPPTGGTTWRPITATDFQNALNSAQPGDIIELEAGTTYQGPFTLPNKTGTGWIYIRTSAHALLPPPGTRVTPAQASLMPKIAIGSGGSFKNAAGAHHYRFVGIEFLPAAGTVPWALVEFGTSATTLSQLPTDIVFDRVYVHSPDQVRIGLSLNGARMAVIDSNLSDIKLIPGSTDGESKTILIYNGSGPFKIVNNYMQAAAINILFGGQDPLISNLVPSDIEFRNNHVTKNAAWQGGPYVIKNLFEFKNARRALVEGNIFEYSWADSQRRSIVFTPRNQNGGCGWCTIEDITFRKNIVRNVANGFMLMSTDNLNTSLSMKRVLIQDVLLDKVDRLLWGEFGYLFETFGRPTDPSEYLTLDHITAFGTHQYGKASFSNDGRFNYATLKNMILSPGGYSGNGTSAGSDTLNTYFPGLVFERNALVGQSSSAYPANNFFPASLSAIQFVDYAGGNYRLAPGSPYENAGTDGKDLGADIDALTAATACVISGLCGVTPPSTP